MPRCRFPRGKVVISERHLARWAFWMRKMRVSSGFTIIKIKFLVVDWMLQQESGRIGCIAKGATTGTSPLPALIATKWLMPKLNVRKKQTENIIIFTQVPSLNWVLITDFSIYCATTVEAKFTENTWRLTTSVFVKRAIWEKWAKVVQFADCTAKSLWTTKITVENVSDAFTAQKNSHRNQLWWILMDNRFARNVTSDYLKN